MENREDSGLLRIDDNGNGSERFHFFLFPVVDRSAFVAFICIQMHLFVPRTSAWGLALRVFCASEN